VRGDVRRRVLRRAARRRRDAVTKNAMARKSDEGASPVDAL